MEAFLIDGPCTLDGAITTSGAKNAALPALAASLLTDEAVTLERLPAVRDVVTMSRVLEHLGARVETDREAGSATIRSDALSVEHEAPYELVKTMRASVLVLGPLVARLGHARVSLPGGCAIGARPIDQHLAGLEAMGASVILEQGYVNVRVGSVLRGCSFRFSMPTVTGTENLLMAACLARGTTVLRNCAREPEIEDLASLLTAMGARISGAGTETITIDGVDSLTSARHRVLGDRIEAGTYLLAGAITRGRISVKGVRARHLQPLLEKLDDCGAVIEEEGETVTLSCPKTLRARDVVTAPHPGFPTDLQAQYLALMTTVDGTATVVENVFENRFQHVPELSRMGADIEVHGNAARVTGSSRLSGATVMATDLRASASLVLAGIAAHGKTRVDRIYHLDRGYHAMESKLQRLGATVVRI